MVHVQTGNMLDVVVEGKSIGLKPRGSNEVLWLPEPEGLVSVLSAEIQRLRPTVASPQDKPSGYQLGVEDAITVLEALIERTVAPLQDKQDESRTWATISIECNYCGAMVKHVCTAFLKSAATPVSTEED